MKHFTLLILISITLAASEDNICWKNSTERAIDSKGLHCDSSDELNGLLCYPLCNDGYYGVGPVCWSYCPEGKTDIGLFCWDWLSTSAKSAYGRGVGTIPHYPCGAGFTEQNGKCYADCPYDSNADGPLCWSSCDENHPSQIGPFCCIDQTSCSNAVESFGQEAIQLIEEQIASGKSVVDSLADIQDQAKTDLGIDFLVCGASKPGACTNTADQTVWNTKGKANMEADLSDCGHSCFGAGDCVTTCIKGKEGYSQGCSECFGLLVDCTSKNCISKCIFGNTPDCAACVEEHCNADFEKCSGIKLD